MLHEKHRPGCADQNLSLDKLSKINLKFVSDSLYRIGVGIDVTGELVRTGPLACLSPFPV